MNTSNWMTPRCGLARAAVVLAALIASYVLAPHLPDSTGWENGPVENAQAVLLFIGGVLALYWRGRASDPRTRAFWLIVAPIWFVLCARELSWGAVFMTPLTFSPDMGPTFSSTHQLSYKAWVTPVIGALLLAIIGLFVATRQTRTLARIWHARAFPFLEIGLFVIAMLLSATAEGHGLFALGGMSHPALQTLEELAELVGYFCLVLAQWRVAIALRGG
ncbi:MAG: hypothetical protein QM617_10560 [Comamonas sp.]